MKCSRCEADGKHYSYVVLYRANAAKTHMELSSLVQRVAFGGITLTQYPFNEKGEVKAYRIFDAPGADSDTSIIKKAKVDINFIDLTKTSPEKLKNKIQTYITFS